MFMKIICWLTLLMCVNLIKCREIQSNYKSAANEINQDFECTSKCLIENSQLVLKDCLQNCIPLNQNNTGLRFNNGLRLVPLCRNDSSLVLDFNNLTLKSDVRQQISVYVFFVVEKNNHSLTGKNVYQSKDSLIVIRDLPSGKLFKVSGLVIYKTGEIYPAADDFEIATLERSFVPELVKNVTMFKFEERMEGFEALVTWTPGLDMTCLYEIALLSIEDGTELILENVWIDSFKYAVLVKNLTFNSHYQIGIRGLNADTFRSSEIRWNTFKTPACSLHCPGTPEEISAAVNHIYGNVFSLDITWNYSGPAPDYFLIKILDLHANETERDTNLAFNVSGSTNCLFLPNVTLQSSDFEVWITSYTAEQQLSSMFKGSTREPLEQSHRQFKIVMIAIGISGIYLILGSICVVCICKNTCSTEDCVKRSTPNNETLQVLDALSKSSLSIFILDDNQILDDRMEICKGRIALHEKLGEGEFGLVRKAILKLPDDKICEVAVKMLKDKPSSRDLNQFRREIEVMKSVGTHPNIVSIIGHCTRDLHEMWLLTEYCGLGNLLNFLRQQWTNLNISKVPCKFSSQTSLHIDVESVFNLDTSLTNKLKVNYKSLENFDRQLPILLENKSYYKLLENRKNFTHTNEPPYVLPRYPITSEFLLKVAKQIAGGMEFLSRKKVVHRDLAARNVLISDDGTCKIADFGLSRDVYHENIYRKTSDGKLPIKWLALESMTHQVYTSQSDVWSYGILLYEIVTLGGTPYPNISTTNLLKHLKSGYRMDRPVSCSITLYNLMRSCWNENSSKRPTFLEIFNMLNNFDLMKMSSSLIGVTDVEFKLQPLQPFCIEV